MTGITNWARRGLGNIAGWGRVATAFLGIAIGSAEPLRAQSPVLPVEIIVGEQPGPTLALVAGVHGGKVAAVQALNALAAGIRARHLRGTLILVRPANVAGYEAGLAQISPDDRLNLNRVFPGRVDGSPTERLAARIMTEIVAKSDYLVDLHGSDGEEAVGAFAYAARPGIDARVDSLARDLARGWGVPLVVWDDEGPRTVAESRFLQTAAHLSGVPAITVFEQGASREDDDATSSFLAGALRILAHLGMLSAIPMIEDPEAARAALRHFPPGSPGRPMPRTLPRRAVHLAPDAGEWTPTLRAGRDTAADELLGVFRDSSGAVDSVRAPAASVVLHQRLPGRVAGGTPLVIFAVVPDSLAPR